MTDLTLLKGRGFSLALLLLVARGERFSEAKASCPYLRPMAGGAYPVPAQWGVSSMRRFTTLTAAAAVLVTSFAAIPAEARNRYGGRHHRDRDHISTGEVLGGLFVIGAIAAIAGAASKDKDQRREQRYEPPYRDDDYREVPRYEPDAGTTPGAYGRGEAEARAADACSWAVEGEMGDDARVDRIDSTRAANGGWYVTGAASRLGGETRSFGCSYRNGRVVDVTFGG